MRGDLRKMTQSHQLVNKLWNYCNILRDDGLSYGDYVEQLTYLLFLKMDDERTKDPYNHKSDIPKKIELILKEDFSLPRNTIIAKAFRFLRFAENIGSGFHKMINGWNKQYHLKPIIEGDFDYYKINFPKDKSGTTTKTTTYTTTKTTIKGEDKEKEIFEIIENNPYLSVNQISSLVNLSIDGVRYHIRNLKNNGRIKRKGHGKGGSWEVLG